MNIISTSKHLDSKPVFQIGNSTDDEDDYESMQSDRPKEIDEELTSNDDENEDQNDINTTDEHTSLWHLIYLLFRRAIPVCLGFVLMFLAGFITMTFAGHIQSLNNNIQKEESIDIFAGMYMHHFLCICIYVISESFDKYGKLFSNFLNYFTQ